MEGEQLRALPTAGNC